ncbi:SAP domain-containing protein [Sarocladium implicatum]|nr:SAP domain-containing protein [Sarocladium implicatum]
MADYASLKVADLKKLLAEKGLSDKGLKPELVARLKEHDAAANGDAKPAETKEDEITYSDDEAAAPSAPAPAPAAAPTEEKPAAESTVASDAAPAPAAPAAAPAEEEKPAVSYAMGLASTAADDEARRRAERAKRFGVEESEESKKLSERAKRFGIDEKEIVGGLDSALPERSLKRGRGRAEGGGSAGARPEKRQSMDRRGGRNRNERRGGAGGGAPQQQKARSVIDDPAEKAKAEARKARFANA